MYLIHNVKTNLLIPQNFFYFISYSNTVQHSLRRSVHRSVLWASSCYAQKALIIANSFSRLYIAKGDSILMRNCKFRIACDSRVLCHPELDEGLRRRIRTPTGFRQAQPDNVPVILKNITSLLFVPQPDSFLNI